jgi:hypothetical protein
VLDVFLTVVDNNSSSNSSVLHVADLLDEGALATLGEHEGSLLLNSFDLGVRVLITSVSVVLVVMDHAHNSLSVWDVAEVSIAGFHSAVYRNKVRNGSNYLL